MSITMASFWMGMLGFINGWMYANTFAEAVLGGVILAIAYGIGFARGTVRRV